MVVSYIIAHSFAYIKRKFTVALLLNICYTEEKLLFTKFAVIPSQCATSRAKSRRFAAVALETRLRAQWRGNPLVRQDM